MVYVIQRLDNGVWIDARDPHGQPLWFFTKREAQQFMRTLGGDHRIIRVKD
jgi:hypothetical protein